MWKGIDISNVNGAFDLAPWKRAGVRVVGVKATEGETFVDDQFSTNVKQCDQLGLIALPYHFGRPESDKGAAGGVKEAEHFLSVVAPLKENKLVGRAVLDYETVPDAAFAQAFLSVLHNRGWMPMVYCSASRVDEIRSRVPRGTLWWIADYGVAALPHLGVPVAIWQFTDRFEERNLDGDRVLIHPTVLTRHLLPAAWYLTVRVRGHIRAQVKAGKGRIARFWDSHKWASLAKIGAAVKIKRGK